MGCYEDDSNRSKLSKLLRFISTKSDGKDISLDKYLDRMQESQESIYYMSGDNMEVMKKAPALQVFKKKDIEVLMLSDHLDEPCIQKLADYEGKKFVSIQKADVKLDETEEEKKKFSKLKDMYKPLTDWWKDKLTDYTEKGAMKEAGVKIEKVELSKRLTESPVVVVTSQFGYSAQQEKIIKSWEWTQMHQSRRSRFLKRRKKQRKKTRMTRTTAMLMTMPTRKMKSQRKRICETRGIGNQPP